MQTHSDSADRKGNTGGQETVAFGLDQGMMVGLANADRLWKSP